MSITRHVGGIFPIVSFLHVPKEMPAPQWLVLGTGFLLHAPSLEAVVSSSSSKNKGDGGGGGGGGLLARIRGRSTKGEPWLILSVAHNFAPWRVPEWKLNIPNDWRKMRFILGNVYQYDQFGSCLKDTACKMSIEAMHPTLDLALLSIPDSGEFIRHLATASAMSGTTDDDDFNLRLSQFKLEPLRKSAFADGAAEEQLFVEAVGFRGRGALGDTRIDGEAATKQLTAEDRARMVEEHRHAVGKQDLHVFSFAPTFKRAKTVGEGEGKKDHLMLVEPGEGFGRRGSPYIGMSGSPVMPSSQEADKEGVDAGGVRVRTACGIFYGGELAHKQLTDGKSKQNGTHARYVPAQDILNWFGQIL